jgi:hypothetical protein
MISECVIVDLQQRHCQGWSFGERMKNPHCGKLYIVLKNPDVVLRVYEWTRKYSLASLAAKTTLASGEEKAL